MRSARALSIGNGRQKFIDRWRRAGFTEFNGRIDFPVNSFFNGPHFLVVFDMAAEDNNRIPGFPGFQFILRHV